MNNETIYKLGMAISLISALAFVTACGSEAPGKGKKAASDSVPGGYFAKIKDKKKTVAYVVSLSQGFATAFLAKAQKYVEIDTSTGEYAQYPQVRSGGIYFPEADCQGNPVFQYDLEGELGKTVVMLTNNKYYLATAKVDHRLTVYEYESTLEYDGDCTNSANNTNFQAPVVQLTETTQPYDFTALNSITLEYE